MSTNATSQAAIERARIAAESICKMVESLPVDDLSRAHLLAKIEATREALLSLDGEARS